MDDDDSEQVEVLGSQNMALDGPFKVELTVFGVVGEYSVQAKIDLRPGTVPNDEAIQKAIRNAANAISEAQPDARLATRHEFVRELLSERAPGVRFAVPGPNGFRLVEGSNR